LLNGSVQQNIHQKKIYFFVGGFAVSIPLKLNKIKTHWFYKWVFLFTWLLSFSKLKAFLYLTFTDLFVMLLKAKNISTFFIYYYYFLVCPSSNLTFIVIHYLIYVCIYCSFFCSSASFCYSHCYCCSFPLQEFFIYSLEKVSLKTEKLV